jgi:hypothetical protein
MIDLFDLVSVSSFLGLLLDIGLKKLYPNRCRR